MVVTLTNAHLSPSIRRAVVFHCPRLAPHFSSLDMVIIINRGVNEKVSGVLAGHDVSTLSFFPEPSSPLRFTSLPLA